MRDRDDRTSPRHLAAELERGLSDITREASRLEAELGSTGVADGLRAILHTAAAMTQTLAQLIGEPTPPPARSAPARVSRPAPAYVLLVDREATWHGELAELLRDDGLELAIATSGSAAFSQAAAQRPAAIVVDLDAGGSEGADIVWRLRSQLGAVPTIVLTKHGIDHPAVATAIELFGAGHLKKPCEPAALVAAVVRSLGPTASASPRKRGTSNPRAASDESHA